MSAEVLLELGVTVEVELVVPEQLQLDGVVAFSIQVNWFTDGIDDLPKPM